MGGGGGGEVGLSVVPQTVAKLANGYNLWLPIFVYIHVTCIDSNIVVYSHFCHCSVYMY